MTNDSVGFSSSWVRAVNAIVQGHSARFRSVRLGPTPTLLKQYGLGPYDLTMSAAKIAKARREHPEVALATWHQRPVLLGCPNAIFPSVRGDGTVVVVIAVVDTDGNPIIVPIIPDRAVRGNTILSVYGKEGTERLSGQEWIDLQVAMARAEGMCVFEKGGSVDSEPKPESADAISWSPDLISVDRSTEPSRDILSIVRKSRLD